MTGFAKVERYENGVKATVELKSVNGRFLEINCRLPKSIANKELEVREIIKKTISRGNVNVQISTEIDESIKPFVLNESAAVSIYRALSSLTKKLKIRNQISISDILAFPHLLLNNNETSYDTELEWSVVKKTLVAATEELDKSRLFEGKNIYKDLVKRVKKLDTLLRSIEKLSVNRVEEEREKLRTKVAQLFENDEIDEQRIQMEILILANKLDINEECTRLHSHIDFLRQTMGAKETVGQKISFILQEINREFNTIASKSDNAQISQIVVNAKEELERIREQIQNIE
jgi:uncharacterized protein (TIGR00255 family)